MKSKLKLQIDLNSPSRRSLVKTPDILRKRDYSPIPLDSPNSIKHRVSVIQVVKSEIEKKKNKCAIEKIEEKEENYNHK
tara:strand:- start:4149 stop:4385 length:237 start_codon:yes stop_codon:yes gene_type:complete